MIAYGNWGSCSIFLEKRTEWIQHRLSKEVECFCVGVLKTVRESDRHLRFFLYSNSSVYMLGYTGRVTNSGFLHIHILLTHSCYLITGDLCSPGKAQSLFSWRFSSQVKSHELISFTSLFFSVVLLSFWRSVHSLLSVDSSRVTSWLHLLFFYSSWWLDFCPALAWGYPGEEAPSLRTTQPCELLVLWILYWDTGGSYPTLFLFSFRILTNRLQSPR